MQPLSRRKLFNEESGQVFQEWITSRPRPALDDGCRDWSRKTPYPPFKGRSPQGSKGCRSLVEMTINVIGDNIGFMTDEHIENVPPRMHRRIWRFLEARGMSLHAWKMLSKSLLKEDEKTLGMYRYRQHICNPSEELSHYLAPLLSPSFDFITCLTISGYCTFRENEILALADLKNLGVLEIIQPADDFRALFPRISDRLIKGWALKEDPFPLLRILRIWGDESTTEESLRYVSEFPSLALYDVIGSRSDWQKPDESAMRHGWEVGEQLYEIHDAILKYLMLFVPIGEQRPKKLRGVSWAIEADMTNICHDSRCVIKFVPDQEAPPLLDYLTDSFRSYTPWANDKWSDATTCHGVAFEAWAFWLYSFIGQLRADKDLKEHGVPIEGQAVAGPFVLPSKPMACLHLGHSGRGGTLSRPSYVSRGMWTTSHYTFVRPNQSESQSSDPIGIARLEPIGEPKPQLPRVDGGLLMKSKKRQRLGDVLGSFG